MFNALLYDKDLRDELTNTDELFAIIETLSSLPEKSKEAGLFTILGVAQFYRTKTQNITDILNEHLDEFMSDGYKQYTQLELINAYTNPFIALKKLKRIEQIHGFVEIEYVDNYIVQILENGRIMLPKKAVLRIACFLENNFIANYIREIFLENKAIVNSQNNQLALRTKGKYHTVE